MTPTHTAALNVARESFAMLRTAVDGLPIEAADWTPAPDTNSLDVLASHCITSARFWFGCGSGVRASATGYQRGERAPSFEAHGKGTAELTAMIDAFQPELMAILEAGTEADLDVTVDWPGEQTDMAVRSGRECLFHAVAHLREHVGQAQLMRDVWLARNPGLPRAVRVT